MKLVVRSLEQKQIELTTYITKLEHQKTIAENYINFLFSHLEEIKILLKKASIALENPKIILACLLYYIKDKDKDFKKMMKL